MFFSTFKLLLPLFALMAGGWVFATLFSISEETLTRILTDFFMPLLVFVSLYRSTIAPADMGRLFFVVSFIVLIPYIIASLYARSIGITARAFVLPIIFMNSGFLGIPLMQLWGGSEAMNIIIIYDQLLTIYLFTFGFFIIGGGASLGGLVLSLKSPILWAVILGFGANLAGIAIPQVLVDTCEFAGNAAPPLAAFVVGCSLHAGKPNVDIHVAAGIFLRMGMGFLLGVFASRIFGLEGTTKIVVIVSGALPSAVFSYVLPSRYGVDSNRAKSMVLISTIIAVLIIPLAFTLAPLF